MGGLQPRCIWRPIEAHYGIDAALGADGRLVLVVAIAPFPDGARRERPNAVVASSHLTAEKRIAVQRRSARSAHGVNQSRWWWAGAQERSWPEVLQWSFLFGCLCIRAPDLAMRSRPSSGGLAIHRRQRVCHLDRGGLPMKTMGSIAHRFSLHLAAKLH